MESNHKPSVYLSWPSGFNPFAFAKPLPHALPPPVKERSFRSPFGIDKDLYNFALRPEIPLTVASIYIFTVLYFNAYNKKRQHKPWSVSQQTWFKYFIVIHNVLLAVYSFATFFAMLRAIVHTLPSWDTDNWAPKTADALCKLHGPRGLGDAATFNTTINIWEVKNTMIKLGYNGNPDPTDVGRLWNEGLAFWGWMFYVSKFYEVLDTFIILAKGKRSATLQTYHHAGAMLCMWAGIRYMSPPIWMFVFINSAIHAMMYTYFTLSALGYKVPQGLKRTLTSLQIAQFVFGASYAAAHLFVSYDIPMEISYRITSVIEHAASSVSSAAHVATKSATSAVSAVSSFAESPTLSPTLGALLKKYLLRAAGEEGVAERVGMQQQIVDGIKDPLGFAGSELRSLEDRAEKWYEDRFETRYRSEWTTVNCIDTSGEAFAIYLNLLYLAPLTFLFARFFVRAYTQRGGPRRPVKAALQEANEAGKDASNQTEYEIERRGSQAEDEVYKRGSQAQDEAKNRLDALRKDVQDLRDGNNKPLRRVSDRVQSYEEKVKTAAEKAAEKAKETADNLRNGRSGSKSGRSSPTKQGRGDGDSAIEDEPAATNGGSKSDEQGGDSSKDEKPQQSQSQPDSQPERSPSKPENTQPQKGQGKGNAKGNNNEPSKSNQNKGGKGGNKNQQKGGSNEPSNDGSPKKTPQKPKLAKPHGQDSGSGEAGKDQSSDSSKAGQSGSQGKPGDDDETYAEAVKKDIDDEDDTAGSKEAQDSNIADSEPTRPGGDATDNDTDAMGKSGSIIDLTKEKAEDTKDEAHDTNGGGSADS